MKKTTKVQEKKMEAIDKRLTICPENTLIDNEGRVCVVLKYLPAVWYWIDRQGHIENRWGRNVTLRNL